jgi:hypothetical protein
MCRLEHKMSYMNSTDTFLDDLDLLFHADRCFHLVLGSESLLRHKLEASYQEAPVCRVYLAHNAFKLFCHSLSIEQPSHRILPALLPWVCTGSDLLEVSGGLT